MSYYPAFEPETAPPATPRSNAQRPSGLAPPPVRRAVEPTTEEEHDRNPTFGPAYWTLGIAAGLPALVSALGLLATATSALAAARPSVGLILGLLLVALALGTLLAHRLDYPAWTHPGVALLPTFGLFLPVVALHGQLAARVNGHPDAFVAVPVAITALLLAATAVVTVVIAFVVGRHAPSFSGVALLPLPLILAWAVLLTPTFREELLVRALISVLALVACATVVAWVVPARYRPLVPVVAVAVQIGVFRWLRLGWPAFGGALRPIVALDLALCVALVLLIAVAPLCAGWMRRAGWPEIQRLLRL